MSLPSRRLTGEEAADAQPYLPHSVRTAFVEPDVSASTVGVRAYLMTGGRASAHLAFETMLVVRPVNRPKHVRFERSAILDACSDTPQSLAEISAHLQIPIGVARVLASDLISEGLLTSNSGPADKAYDITLLTKLIDGVRAL